MKSIFLLFLLTASPAFAMSNEEQSVSGDTIIFNSQLVIGENISTAPDGSTITTTVTRKIGKSDFTVITSEQKYHGAPAYAVPNNLIVVERLKQKANALFREKMQEAFLDQASVKKSKSLPSLASHEQ